LRSFTHHGIPIYCQKLKFCILSAIQFKGLERFGYEVAVRVNYVDADHLSDEDSFDLVILALHLRLDEAVPYSDRLTRNNPSLPILLLMDFGVFVPRGTLSRSLEAGDPIALMKEVAAMLAGSSHLREITAYMSE
jgi:hypothetical protein